MLMFNNSPKWFTGIVESREDPLMLGRVQVRIHGVHPSLNAPGDIKGLPTEDLIWVNPVQDITSAAISGIGNSPTGMVEGTLVFGVALDEYYLNCLILGTIAGSYTEKPVTTEGFCDPSGTYPRYIGNDVNILARGGVDPTTGETKTPDSVYIRDENTGVAVNPDDTPLDEIPPDDNPDFTIEKMLRGDEGYRERWYTDSEGYPTIGIGHLIIAKKTKDQELVNKELTKLVGREVTNGRLTGQEVSKVFADDIEKTRRSMRNHPRINPVYSKMNASRRMALENMAFQMGVGGLAKFKNSLAAMLAGEWQKAYDGLRASVWANQTPGRSNRVSKIILTGNLESYGVMVKQGEASYLSVEKTDDPEDPFHPTDTRIMFKEPESAYAAQYPYNHVYESESGHIQEFDDTPGHERYHRKHPAGTFEEIRPSGDRVVKIEGDDYLIVKQGRKLNVKGNLQVVIEGDAQAYYMGNVTQTIDGNVTEFVRGNIKQNVEGNASYYVKGDAELQVDGNATASVKGDATISVEGDCNQTVKGNYTMTVHGNYTLSVQGQKVDNVSGEWTRTCSKLSDTATGEVFINGSRINLG